MQDFRLSLLFGLLAYQTGLISQSNLVNVLRIGVEDETCSFGESLVERSSDATRQLLLQSLVVEHLKLHCGDVEKSLAAVPAGTSTGNSFGRWATPSWMPRWPMLARPLRPPNRSARAESSGTFLTGADSTNGQRFRVLRPHAKGGLGAVFVALDQELHREVALKQILDDHADDQRSRARFLIEAEITGGLEHPGIVPVYGLGTYADGRPYYAMRFIRGDSLKEAIERFHADETLKKDPGVARWSCGNCCGGSWTSATPSSTRTAAASCTAT